MPPGVRQRCSFPPIRSVPRRFDSHRAAARSKVLLFGPLFLGALGRLRVARRRSSSVRWRSCSFWFFSDSAAACVFGDVPLLYCRIALRGSGQPVLPRSPPTARRALAPPSTRRPCSGGRTCGIGSTADGGHACDRPVVKVALHVGGEAVGRLVAAVAVLLQALHHDPVQLAAHQLRQLGRLRCLRGPRWTPAPRPSRSAACSAWAAPPP